MGVDAKVYLPPNTRLDTVNDVICRLLDAPMEKWFLGDSHPGAWAAHPKKNVVKQRSYSNIPGMAGVTITKIDYTLYGQKCMGFSYHFEFGGPRRGKNNGGSRGIMMRAYAVNIAIFKRLADFFGGTVDYCDCDSKENDYVVPHRTDSENCPEDGKPWQALQQRIWDVQKLTQAEIDACEKFASYHESEEEKADRLAGGKKTVKKPARTSPRYTVVNEDGVKFWVMDNDTNRRLRPTNGEEAWLSEEVAKDHAHRLNKKESRRR